MEITSKPLFKSFSSPASVLVLLTFFPFSYHPRDIPLDGTARQRTALHGLPERHCHSLRSSDDPEGW